MTMTSSRVLGSFFLLLFRRSPSLFSIKYNNSQEGKVQVELISLSSPRKQSHSSSRQGLVESALKTNSSMDEVESTLNGKRTNNPASRAEKKNGTMVLERFSSCHCFRGDLLDRQHRNLDAIVNGRMVLVPACE